MDYVKVLDFGLVKIFAPEETGVSAPYGDDHLTRAGCMVGTPEYISPEQAIGERVDGRTDIYSLGVLMFQMITGKLPFTGANILEIVNQHFTSDVPKLCEIAPDVECPSDLERIIRKCLSKLAADRYKSTDELLAELKLLWRVVMDESCTTEPSIALLDFEMRPQLPTGLRPETIAGAPNSLDQPVTIPPFKRPDFPDDDVEAPIVDPSEASNHLRDSPMPQPKERMAKRPGRTIGLVLVCLAMAIALGASAYLVLGVKSTLFSSGRAEPIVITPRALEKATPIPEPAVEAKPAEEGNDEPAQAIDNAKTEDLLPDAPLPGAPLLAPKKSGHRSHRTKGYKENPF